MDDEGKGRRGSGFTDILPDLVEKSSRNPLGIVALVIIAIAGIGLALFGDASENVKLVVFLTVAVICGSFALMVLKDKPKEHSLTKPTAAPWAKSKPVPTNTKSEMLANEIFDRMAKYDRSFHDITGKCGAVSFFCALIYGEAVDDPAAGAVFGIMFFLFTIMLFGLVRGVLRRRDIMRLLRKPDVNHDQLRRDMERHTWKSERIRQLFITMVAES